MLAALLQHRPSVFFKYCTKHSLTQHKCKICKILSNMTFGWNTEGVNRLNTIRYTLMRD